MRRLSDLGEFELIRRIRAKMPDRDPAHVRLGIGDDAALLRPPAGSDLAVTADTLVEGVHFRFQSQSARNIGRRSLAVNLSDLAAMGARPLAFTLAIAAPPATSVRRFDDLIDGVLAESVRFACPLIGGNLTRAREISLAVTVLGSVSRGGGLRRDAALAGDRILVTGQLGSGALARHRAERGGGPMRHVPTPRLRAGQALGRLKSRGACIDISDGLAADLGHLLEASSPGAGSLGAEIDSSRLPRPRGFAAACRALKLRPERLLATGGEDYELLFTVRPSAPSETVLARRLGVPVTEIGAVLSRPGIRGLDTGRAGAGWQHF